MRVVVVVVDGSVQRSSCACSPRSDQVTRFVRDHHMSPNASDTGRQLDDPLTLTDSIQLLAVLSCRILQPYLLYASL